MSVHAFDRVTAEELRARQSAKWRVYPDDVLPAWVAEMDYPLAEPVQRVLREALDANDTGYADPRGLGEAFAPWARETWGWEVAPSDVRVAPDVVTAIGELLLVATSPGDGVVINPPVYPPFASTIRRLGRTVQNTPLTREGGSLRLDLAAIERAYAEGAKVHILCSPHNPTGTVHTRRELEALATLATRHGVLILSDEIHAPLTYDDAVHTPIAALGDEGARSTITLTSASKTYNLAGLKASVMVATHDASREILARIPPELGYHAGHLGVLGARAAFAHGGPWLTETRAILRRNRERLGELLAAHLPDVRYDAPKAGYLAWLDCSALGLGDDPAAAFLARGRVALSPGPTFGVEGRGFVRLNFATTETLLEDVVMRMRAAL